MISIMAAGYYGIEELLPVTYAQETVIKKANIYEQRAFVSIASRCPVDIFA